MSKNTSIPKSNTSNPLEPYETDTSTQFLPPRTPLNTITDPINKPDNKLDTFDSQLSKALTGLTLPSSSTPRVFGRGRLIHSEPSSANGTPARGGGGNSRVRQSGYRGGGGGSSRVSRGLQIVVPEGLGEAAKFELEDDSSFWNDHNVQVLIRVRPLSNTEMVSQGCGRCLRQESAQTLVWLGHPETRFTFDHVACEMISQEKLFKVVGLPMVDNCMSGYNSCIFAYGQTGSGKTYTMMGEICQMDGKFDEDCGITPRIFEYLFTKIREEEEKRQDERLSYICKCSFLEIYNEQITDLLEPTSTNLQLREDLKKGVYVEDLTEHSVRNVNDVLKLLLQGAANRKMAATHMNSESSRSHSVFTCTVESRWEKDSMTHFRFGRLNLVDLAGSERQKSSGAEGDRLKEAANINKSLSTLGLVIMSLVDLAHGKQRHVPYRDSRLTFLLQDSLGGNSKTTIIANISPSICSANETLSTLKFAQRAKLIQNNAKINEDASGNVTAMQRQIQQLQGQLSFLMTHHNISRPNPSSAPSLQQSSVDESLDEYNFSDEEYSSHDNTLSAENKKIKSLEATLAISLKREKSAQVAGRRLKAQIEHLNCTAQQKEDEAQYAQMKLKSAEEKIRKLESFADGLVLTDKYIMEENKSLKEQNQLLMDMKDRQQERYMDSLGDDAYQKDIPQSMIRRNSNKLDKYSSASTDALQAKLDRLTKELEKAQSQNCQYQENQKLQLSQSHNIQLVCEQVEIETSQTILHLQEEVSTLQYEFDQKLTFMVEENKKLREALADKEDEIRSLSKEWERATLELTNFLVQGSKYLNKASGQVTKIVGSFPSTDIFLGEHVEMAAKVCIGKEETILLLHKSLEEAQDMVLEMEHKLDSLKGAAHVFSEVNMQSDSAKVFVENNIKQDENMSKFAMFSKGESQYFPETKTQGKDFASQETKAEVEMARQNLEKRLFNKLDKALATTEEADKMLHALVEANENAQEMTNWWKEACEKLMIEKASFSTVTEELKSKIYSKDEKIAMLQHHNKDGFKDVVQSVIELEQNFCDLKKDVDEILKVMHFDALTMAHNVIKYFCDSKLSIKAISSVIMEKETCLPVLNQFQKRLSSMITSVTDTDNVVDYENSRERTNQSEVFKRLDETESAETCDILVNETSMLKKELEQKENVLQGLLFDFSLLQESASTKKDMKDEIDKLMTAFSQVQKELQRKTDQLNHLLVQHSELEDRLTETENALVMSISDFEQVKGTVDLLSDKNDKLKLLLKDINIRKSEVEEQLEEEREVVKTLENEILRINSSPEKKLSSLILDTENNFRVVTAERDQLLEEVVSLQDRLKLAYSLVDENDAIAVEARQESEASKIYAEQKEEEVKILEHSVEELECTINVLQQKVYGMEEEVEKQKLVSDLLESELQALQQRIVSVESITEDRLSENSNAEQLSGDQMSRQLHKDSSDLHEVHSRIRHLEKEKEEQDKKIKQYNEYISELVLHADAQASQYQQKYKTLEEMTLEVSKDSSNLASLQLTEDKQEKILMRPKGSSSPFKCISSLVQQVNSEKDRELSAAKLHIVELEELAASRLKEVCTLNTRLATTESMTHDVIRDLLGVKFDITGFADLMDKYQLQKLVENAQIQAKESAAMEQEILNLRREIDELVEEREIYMSELNIMKADILSAEVTVEKLQERDQLLATQNEMLKADNGKLKRNLVDMDEVVNKLYATQSAPMQTQHQVKLKENKFPKQQGDSDLSRRLKKSDELLLRVNNESRIGKNKVEDVHFLERRNRNLR